MIKKLFDRIFTPPAVGANNSNSQQQQDAQQVQQQQKGPTAATPQPTTTNNNTNSNTHNNNATPVSIQVQEQQNKQEQSSLPPILQPTVSIETLPVVTAPFTAESEFIYRRSQAKLRKQNSHARHVISKLNAMGVTADKMDILLNEFVNKEYICAKYFSTQALSKFKNMPKEMKMKFVAVDLEGWKAVPSVFRQIALTMSAKKLGFGMLHVLCCCFLFE